MPLLKVHTAYLFERCSRMPRGGGHLGSSSQHALDFHVGPLRGLPLLAGLAGQLVVDLEDVLPVLLGGLVHAVARNPLQRIANFVQGVLSVKRALQMAQRASRGMQ